MTTQEPVDTTKWYPLDGTWHPSVNTRSSYHLATVERSALCAKNPEQYMLNFDDLGYSDNEVRRKCKRCLAKREAAKKESK